MTEVQLDALIAAEQATVLFLTTHFRVDYSIEGQSISYGSSLAAAHTRLLEYIKLRASMFPTLTITQAL